jgi:hypothetical protein
MPLRQIFGDRQRIPDDGRAVVQARHAHRRRERAVRGIEDALVRQRDGTSSNGAPASLVASQPRSDHDE